LNESLVYNLQIEENKSSDEYVFDHPNSARRALKNAALGISFVTYLDAFACMVVYSS
jgi:hypothetical protein